MIDWEQRRNQSIDSALDYLKRKQLEDGEFVTWAGPRKDLKSGAHFDSAVFATSIILYSLRFLALERIEPIAKNSVQFLLCEMEGIGFWKYWSSKHPRHEEAPPDLDDVACVSLALEIYGHQVPDNKRWILEHRNEEGIFYTWFVPNRSSSSALKAAIRDVWHPTLTNSIGAISLQGVIDCVVNANILCYLRDCPSEALASLEHLICAVESEREIENSEYYHRLDVIYYFISRAFYNGISELGQIKDTIISRLRAGECRESGMSLALYICTLKNFQKTVPRKLAEQLLNLQADDGHWSREVTFLGPAPYYGSDELSTGFAVEALSRIKDL